MVKLLEPKDYVYLINKMQYVNYFENNKFIKNYSELGLEYEELKLGKFRGKYSYIIEVDNNKALVKAAPKIEGIKSYIGVVFVSKTAKDKSIMTVCESNEPSRIVPPVPKLVGEKLVCLPGSTEINRNS